jgi:hypothetical protein
MLEHRVLRVGAVVHAGDGIITIAGSGLSKSLLGEVVRIGGEDSAIKGFI